MDICGRVTAGTGRLTASAFSAQREQNTAGNAIAFAVDVRGGFVNFIVASALTNLDLIM